MQLNTLAHRRPCAAARSSCCSAAGSTAATCSTQMGWGRGSFSWISCAWVLWAQHYANRPGGPGVPWHDPSTAEGLWPRPTKRAPGAQRPARSVRRRCACPAAQTWSSGLRSTAARQPAEARERTGRSWWPFCLTGGDLGSRALQRAAERTPGMRMGTPDANEQQGQTSQLPTCGLSAGSPSPPAPDRSANSSCAQRATAAAWPGKAAWLAPGANTAATRKNRAQAACSKRCCSLGEVASAIWRALAQACGWAGTGAHAVRAISGLTGKQTEETGGARSSRTCCWSSAGSCMHT